MSLEQLLKRTEFYEIICTAASGEMRDIFYERFYRGLRQLRSEIESDIHTLKERKFDINNLRKMIEIHSALSKIDRESNHLTAITALTKYVSESPNKEMISELNVKAKEHIKNTNVDMKEGLLLGNPQIRSLDNLKLFAEKISPFTK